MRLAARAGCSRAGRRGTCSAPAARRPDPASPRLPGHRAARRRLAAPRGHRRRRRRLRYSARRWSRRWSCLGQPRRRRRHGLVLLPPRAAARRPHRRAAGPPADAIAAAAARAARAAGRAGAALAARQRARRCRLRAAGERWAHEVAVPEFEIDAQCVNWAQFAEFAEDGGYDKRECWSEAGWQRLGSTTAAAHRATWNSSPAACSWRAPGNCSARRRSAGDGGTRHEAQAWCRWAGRRPPTEPEWELAAHVAARRGFARGDVLEWVAGSARPFAARGAGRRERWTSSPLPKAKGRARARPAQPAACCAAAPGATPARWRHAKLRAASRCRTTTARAAACSRWALHGRRSRRRPSPGGAAPSRWLARGHSLAAGVFGDL
ncbi:MAG: SUMF1/EgtB/PvdO family nonheme iron enzyme [Rubrivivax sp.]